MSEPAPIRRGDAGRDVRDLQHRLRGAGFVVEPGEVASFGSATEAAVRAFQQARGLRVDGICGPHTWAALVESSYCLGDRLLYVRRPMLRGDDVTELQRRLNALGFDAAREDGILGPQTEEALRQFQRNAGLAADGVCGPSTRSALDRLGSLAAGSVAHTRERDALLRDDRHLATSRLFLAATPELEVLGHRVSRQLGATGASVVFDASGPDDSVLAAEANRFDADLFLLFRLADHSGSRCVFFANQRFRSEMGWSVATRLDAALDAVLGRAAEPPGGRTYPVLRETRMPAVVCELAPRDDQDRLGRLVTAGHDIAVAVADGIRRGIEEPPGDPISV